MHESQTFPDCYFLTLTLSDEYMAQRGHSSLDKTELQKFFKRLRHHYKGVKFVKQPNGEYKNPIRYYACGEYGEQTERPHYHACVFNLELDDLEVYKKQDGYWLYNSQRLDSIWTCPESGLPMGHIVIGSVTFDSAAYCARYMLKKQKGKTKNTELVNSLGEVVEQEFTLMSRRPGIGWYWYQEYKNDLYPKDFVIVNGKKSNVPRSYDKYLESEAPDILEEVKMIRELKAEEHLDNNTPERLKVREACAVARLKTLTRTTE